MSRSRSSDRPFILLEELMFTHHAVSEKDAIEKKNIVSDLDKLNYFKEKEYIFELDNGKIFLTKKGVQALLAHFS
jgi:hypothetical protein